MKLREESREYYERAFQGVDYLSEQKAETHAYTASLSAFIAANQLQEGRCLEVGTGRGAFQDLVADYYGIDIAFSAGAFVAAPFSVASATELPFPSATFDSIWTVTVLEHVPDPEHALLEMWRVLKPGGYLFLAPAWQCRSWAAEGYQVRPYADFDIRGKLIKTSIPLRDSVLFRSLSIFPRRILRLAAYMLERKPMEFHYRRLVPNYEQFWQSDSDAVNSMDPFEAYLWFVSRKANCLSHDSLMRGLLIRTGALIFQKLDGAKRDCT